MKRLIRHSVFETNSSSCHSITLSNDVEKYDTLYPNSNGVFVFEGGEFGWEWDAYSDAYAKANYIVTYLNNFGHNAKFKQLFEQVIKDHVKCEIEYDLSSFNYIDHQSVGVAASVMKYSYDELKNFIFNPKSVLYTGNDNDGKKWQDGIVVDGDPYDDEEY